MVKFPQPYMFLLAFRAASIRTSFDHLLEDDDHAKSSQQFQSIEARESLSSISGVAGKLSPVSSQLTSHTTKASVVMESLSSDVLSELAGSFSTLKERKAANATSTSLSPEELFNMLKGTKNKVDFHAVLTWVSDVIEVLAETTSKLRESHASAQGLSPRGKIFMKWLNGPLFMPMEQRERLDEDGQRELTLQQFQTVLSSGAQLEVLLREGQEYLENGPHAKEMYRLIRRFGPLPYTFNKEVKTVRDDKAFVERVLSDEDGAGCFFDQHIYDYEYSLWVRAKPTQTEVQLWGRFKSIDRCVGDQASIQWSSVPKSGFLDWRKYQLYLELTTGPLPDDELEFLKSEYSGEGQTFDAFKAAWDMTSGTGPDIESVSSSGVKGELF